MTHIWTVYTYVYVSVQAGIQLSGQSYFNRIQSASITFRVYDLYSFQVIPVMGQIFAGDWKSYQYLVESIRKFPNQELFSEMIRSAGFKCVAHENLFNGVAAIHVGFKI